MSIVELRNQLTLCCVAPIDSADRSTLQRLYCASASCLKTSFKVGLNLNKHCSVPGFAPRKQGFQIKTMSKKERFRHCDVPNCHTYTVRGLYLIPEHPVRRQTWIDICKFGKVTNRLLVCYKHFKQSDFKSDIDYENIGTCHFPCLNIGAVPSLHLSNSELEQESVPDLNTECDIETKPHLSNNPITVVSKYLRVLLSINFPKDSTLKF